MTPERKSELMEQAAVMIAAAEGKEIERRRAFTDGWELMGDDASFDFSCSEYRIKKVPTVRYIPFTAETFKEHRDRWMKRKGNKIYSKSLLYDYNYLYYANGTSFTWRDLLENCEFDDTGEPCGQKVEE